MPKFTPGPWAVERDGLGVFSRSGDCSIVDMAAANSDVEKDANARLIAAAPDMYTFLKLTWRILYNEKALEHFREFLMEDIIDLCNRIDGEGDNE